MRSLIKLVVPFVSFVLAMPAIAQAQSNDSLSRTQVREHLVQLEKAGYSPLVNDPFYPRRLQQAENTLSQKQDADASYGPGVEGTVRSGR